MNIRNVANLFVLLFLIWLLLTGTLELTSLLLGLTLAVTLALIFGKNSNVFGRFRMTPKVFVYSLIYLFVLSWEIVKSNIDVALRVLNPKLPINPG